VTAITRNGHTPNYAFRVSVSDEYADEFLVWYALEVTGARVREVLERLEPYDGLVKRYAPAFTPERHDALLAELDRNIVSTYDVIVSDLASAAMDDLEGEEMIARDLHHGDGGTRR